MSTPLQGRPGRLRAAVTADDHVRGADPAVITLVEYADLQCPHCAAAHGVLTDVLRQRADLVRVVFRHFPIVTVHPYAEVAAETLEAAGARGRFWALHDWIYEHQDQLDPVHLSLGAAQVGLPVDEVAHEVNTHTHLERVRRHFVDAIRCGVAAAPTFFLNGERHEGAAGLPDLLAAVDEAARDSG